eukprot:4723261-Amphidinium_carterae.1
MGSSVTVEKRCTNNAQMSIQVGQCIRTPSNIKPHALHDVSLLPVPVDPHDTIYFLHCHLGIRCTITTWDIYQLQPPEGREYNIKNICLQPSTEP